jgi:hypothetical protein
MSGPGKAEPMTAAELAELARLADAAADRYSHSNPSWARILATAAHVAGLAAADQQRRHDTDRIAASLAEIKAALR